MISFQIDLLGRVLNIGLCQHDEKKLKNATIDFGFSSISMIFTVCLLCTRYHVRQ